MTTELDDDAYFDVLRSTFHGAPITQHVRQRLDVPAKGTATVTLAIDPRLHHAGGALHGGIVGLVLDNAGFFAAASTTGGQWVVTSEFKVNLLEPAAGEVLVATGTVLRRGRNLVHTEMRATTAGGTLVAVGLGTYAIVPRRFRGA
jgi:uncharacterized protein (TIGR00369 family)